MRFVDERRISIGVFVAFGVVCAGTIFLSFLLNDGTVHKLDVWVVLTSLAFTLPVRKHLLKAWRQRREWTFGYAFLLTARASLVLYTALAWIELDRPKVQPGALGGVGLKCSGGNGRMIPPEVMPEDPKAIIFYRCVSPQAYREWQNAQDAEGAKPIGGRDLLAGLMDLWVVPRAFAYGLGLSAIFWLYVFGQHWRVETEGA